MNGFDAQQDDVFRLVTQKMNKHRRIAIKRCLCTQSAFKQLSGGVLSILFRGSAVGRRSPELQPAGSQDVAKKLQKAENRATRYQQHVEAFLTSPHVKCTETVRLSVRPSVYCVSIIFPIVPFEDHGDRAALSL